jgi:hypothetical protein
VPGAGALGEGRVSDVPLPPGQTFEAQFSGLPAPIDPGAEAQVYLVVHADKPGPLGFYALDVAYRAGPFTFHAIQHMRLNMCLGPMPSGTFRPYGLNRASEDPCPLVDGPARGRARAAVQAGPGPCSTGYPAARQDGTPPLTQVTSPNPARWSRLAATEAR